VEVAAGDKKKVFTLQSSFGTPGAYKTSFYPTVQTTLSYRIFGTIENVPVNFTFTCSPAGHARVPEDTTEVKVSDQVTRLSKRGSFGCPVAKSEVGFPEAASSAFELQTKIASMESALAGAQSQAGTARLLGIAGLIAGLAGLGIGMAALKNRKKSQDHTSRRKNVKLTGYRAKRIFATLLLFFMNAADAFAHATPMVYERRHPPYWIRFLPGSGYSSANISNLRRAASRFTLRTAAVRMRRIRGSIPRTSEF
jgi:hypothetical protein